MLAVIINPFHEGDAQQSVTILRHRGGLLKIVEEVHKHDDSLLDTFKSKTQDSLGEGDVKKLEEDIREYNLNYTVPVLFFEEVPGESILKPFNTKESWE